MQGPTGKRTTRQSGSRSGYTLVELMIVLAILATIAGISWPALMRPWSRSLAQQAAQQLTVHVLEARTRAIEDSCVYRLRYRPGHGDFVIDVPTADLSETDRLNGRPADVSPHPEATLVDASATTPRVPLDARAAPVESTEISTGMSTAPAPVQPRESLHVEDVLDHGVRFRDRGGVNPFNTADEAITGTTDANPSSAERAEMDRPPTLSEDDPLAAVEAEAADIAWSDPVWFYPDGRTSSARWTLVAEEGYQVDVLLRGLTGTVRVGPVRTVPAEPEVRNSKSEIRNRFEGSKYE